MTQRVSIAHPYQLLLLGGVGWWIRPWPWPGLSFGTEWNAGSEGQRTRFRESGRGGLDRIGRRVYSIYRNEH